MLVADRGQEIVDDVVLPVAHLSVALEFCFSILNVVNV